jgi:hypothetical protein
MYGLKDSPMRDKNGTLIIGYKTIEQHKSGEKAIPSNFFSLPGAEYISAVLFTNSGTWAKFNRMGYQAGYHRGNIQVIRQGMCYNDDDNSVEPLHFMYDLDDPMTIEDWGQGIEIIHNPNALFPIPRYFIKGSAIHFENNGKIMTECLPFHPFSSTTLTFLHEEVDHAISTQLKDNLVNLLKYEFDGFNHARQPGAENITEEKEWYADNDRNILGIVFRDTIDDDFGHLVLGADGDGIFRTIDVEAGIQNRSQARDELFKSMEKIIRSGQKVFPKD